MKNITLYRKNSSVSMKKDPRRTQIQNLHPIYYALDKNRRVLSVFVVSLKAFDTVNHGILLKKLKNYRHYDKINRKQVDKQTPSCKYEWY